MLFTHTGIELLAGSMLFIRGEAGGVDAKKKVTAEDRMYRRWHGAGLLSLAFMGGLALRSSSEAGVTLTLRVCCLFHALASAVGFAKVLEGDGGGWKMALLNPHNAIAVGFACVLLQDAHA